MLDVADADSVIRDELTPREQLLWSGWARTGIILRPIDAFLIPLNLLFAIFFCFMFAGPINQGGDQKWIAMIAATVFILLAVYGAFGRLFVDARRRSKTCYGVTNERVIIVQTGNRRVVRSLIINNVSDMTLRESDSGAGSITFGPQSWYLEWMETTSSWPGANNSTRVRLDLANDARRIYEIILAAQTAGHHA